MSDRYGLDPAFEQVVAALCAQRPKFLGSIGYALEPDAFKNPIVSLIVKTAQVIFKDVGHGPSAPAMLFQRMRQMMHDGTVTKEEIDDAMDMLIDIPKPLPTDFEVITLLAPVLKRRAQKTAIHTAMDDFSNKRDFSRVRDIIHSADRIGVQDTSIGLRFGPQAFSEVARLNSANRLPFGIPELDAMLGGGVKRGSSVVILASSGRGKSQMLCQLAANSIVDGKFVGYITLELAEALIFARIAGNVLYTPVSAIEEDKKIRRRAKKKLGRIMDVLGPLLIKEMPAKVTSMLDVRTWVKEAEEDMGRPMDVLCLDYADKLKSHRKEDQNSYTQMDTVYEDFRLFLHDTKKWGATASQAKRGAGGSGKSRRVEAEDVSDSMGKLRTADYVITQALDDDGEQITFFIGKNRTGRQDISVGPFPHDWVHGRMVHGERYPSVEAALQRSQP